MFLRRYLNLAICIYKMPIYCEELPKETLLAVNEKLTKLPAGHPLRGNNVVKRDGDVVIIQSDDGRFYYYRSTSSIDEVIKMDCELPREYLCSVFIVDDGEDDDKDVVAKLRNRLQENHGEKMAHMIDHHVTHVQGKTLMLVKFPSCVVRHMLAPGGGLLKTIYSGPLNSLQQIPVLAKFLSADPSDAETDRRRSVFATQYSEGNLQLVQSVHYDILRDVMQRPNMGICIGPIAQWDAGGSDNL